jgi:hypothetical protein
MASPGPNRASEPPESRDDDRLDSWKEIAAYLKRDVRTVHRWEAEEGLPRSQRSKVSQHAIRPGILISDLAAMKQD